MEYSNILVEKTASLATVTVNRPQVLNALNRQTIEELECAFYELRADEAVRAVILTGAGPKAFVAGADIKELSQLDASQGVEFARRGQAVLELIENLGKPVIAAINGYALGGGLELAMACHLRLAAEGIKVGQPEINLGVIPGFGGTQRLARLVGEGRALELVLGGDQIDAAEAHRLGLVNQVVAADKLMEQARALGEKLAGKPALAVRYALEAVHHGLQSSLAEGLNLEAKLFGLCCATADKAEGTGAFLEKRRPRFSGR
ncbi:MAG: enoyl-CoA hydratase [Deltaproteobacteria bacterium]|nr:MAG: enoyl-CoA hydratase [Deltaproteobacteria bacterium]